MFFFFSSRRRHTRSTRDWSSDVCSSDLAGPPAPGRGGHGRGRPHDRQGLGLGSRGTRDRLPRVRLHEGVRRADGRGQAGRPRGAGGPGGARGDRSRAHRRHRAQRGAPLHQPALRPQAGRDPAGPGGLMAERLAERPADRGAERGPVPGTSARPDAATRAARRARREQGRWVREVKGILALALAGFSSVALFAYEPTVHLLDQSSPVGPVGVWLGWIFFWAFGYAGFLFPLLLAGYGASAFI